MPKIIGHNTQVVVAINAATAGVTFDGTPGTADCFRIKSGGFSYEDRLPKTPLEEATVFQRDHVQGGLIVSWSMELFWSYSYREKLDQLIAGGAITTTGASVPYTHTQALVTKLLNGNIKVQYTDQAAQVNEVFQDEFENAVVTGMSKVVEVGSVLMGTISGIASKRNHLENVAALTTVQDNEEIPWTHFAPTFDGTAYCGVSKINIDINAALEEAPFGMCATNPATPFGNFRAGQMVLTWGVDMFADSDVLAQANIESDWTGANTIIANNGGATTAEREYSITLGDSFIDGVQGLTLGTLGLVPISIKLHAEHEDGGTELIATHYKNARTTIPA
jgi:hypothetical protein